MGGCVSRRKRRRGSSDTDSDPDWAKSNGGDRILLENCGMMMNLGQTLISGVDYEFIHSDGCIDGKHENFKSPRRRKRQKKQKSWLLVIVKFGPLSMLKQINVDSESKYRNASAESKYRSASAATKYRNADVAEIEYELTEPESEQHTVSYTNSEQDQRHQERSRYNEIGIVIKFREMFDYQGYKRFPIPGHYHRRYDHNRAVSGRVMRSLMDSVDSWVGKYIVFSTIQIDKNTIWTMVVGSFESNTFETYFFKGSEVYTWMYKAPTLFLNDPGSMSGPVSLSGPVFSSDT